MLSITFAISIVRPVASTDPLVLPEYGVSFVRHEHPLLNGHSSVRLKIELMRVQTDKIPIPIHSSAKIHESGPVRTAAKFLDSKVNDLYANVVLLRRTILRLVTRTAT